MRRYCNFIHSLLALPLLLAAIGCQHRIAPPTLALAPEIHDDLQKQLQRPSDELFHAAPGLKFTPAAIENMRRHLRESQDYCTGKVSTRASEYERQGRQLTGEIDRAGKSMNDGRRHELHCRIQDLRSSKAQADILAQNLIPVAFGNHLAKLELIEKWPAELLLVQQQIASGASQQRRWGNVQEIGFREIQKDQKDDIKRGEDAIRELRQQGAMSQELENKDIQDYVNTLAQRIARNSDLQVPLKTRVLDSSEVNTFALPGGFLFIQRGLLEEVDDESELAGVLAHEMSHVAARHSFRLYKKAVASSILYTAAQVAAIIFTGGAAGIGTYYALQYGFYGLGFALNLDLLGVSREFELEADQLGIQYAWKSGYDTEGFIRFSDKLARKQGYAIGASWFRTHPPFYQRMVESKREIMFLPPKAEVIVQTHDFEIMKQQLKDEAKKAEASGSRKPTLHALEKEEGCGKPTELFKPAEPVDAICARFEKE